MPRMKTEQVRVTAYTLTRALRAAGGPLRVIAVMAGEVKTFDALTERGAEA